MTSYLEIVLCAVVLFLIVLLVVPALYPNVTLGKMIAWSFGRFMKTSWWFVPVFLGMFYLYQWNHSISWLENYSYSVEHYGHAFIIYMQIDRVRCFFLMYLFPPKPEAPGEALPEQTIYHTMREPEVKARNQRLMEIAEANRAGNCCASPPSASTPAKPPVTKRYKSFLHTFFELGYLFVRDVCDISIMIWICTNIQVIVEAWTYSDDWEANAGNSLPPAPTPQNVLN
jgi:hypothetical protein